MSHLPVLGLLTDFGLTDGYVGVMKAVALAIAPNASLVDISHDIAPQDIEMGAWTLGMAWRYFPVGSVLLCVVDPGVGSERRAIALEMSGRFFVGPDNGLFTYPLDERTDDSAPVSCVSLDEPRYHLQSPSATFHGRDIFAPCAAHLATGVPLMSLGSVVNPATLVRLSSPRQPVERDGMFVGRVAHVDHYGNLITNFGPELARLALRQPHTRLVVGQREISARATHFAAGPVSEPFLLQDSSGALAIAARNGSAALALGVRRGDEARLLGVVAPAAVSEGTGQSGGEE